MLSVIIPARNQARDLQDLLAALVPAAVEGLVREVIVADAEADETTRALCEDAGAELAGGLSVAAPRHPWVLVLPPEIRLKAGWAAVVTRHLERRGGRAVIQGEGGGLFRRGPRGVLVEAEQVDGTTNLAALRRRVRGPVIG